MGVLETAMKIANQDADGEDEEEDGQKEAARVKNNNKTLPNCHVIFVQPRNLLCSSFNESEQCVIVCHASFFGRLLNHYCFLCCTSCIFRKPMLEISDSLVIYKTVTYY